MSDDILGKVQKIVSEQLGVDEAEVKPEANFA
ncbi:MAG: acyl carrier protein, partial [Cyanobacteria bacterium J06597_16]